MTDAWEARLEQLERDVMLRLDTLQASIDELNQAVALIAGDESTVALAQRAAVAAVGARTAAEAAAARIDELVRAEHDTGGRAVDER